MTTLDSSPNEEVQNTNVEANTAKPQNDVVPNKDYIELQSVYTQNRQALIDATIELSRDNPKRILDITDKKLQEKVIKSLYWLDNLQELQMINGTDFWKTTSEKEEDEVEKLKKKVAIMELTSKKSEVEAEIAKFIAENKELFDEETELQLRNNLDLLSPSIDIKERVRLAGKLSIGIDSTKKSEVDAYKQLMASQWREGSGSSADVKTTKQTQVEDKQKKLREFLMG